MIWLLLILISAIPVGEWRVSVPLGILKYGLSPYEIFLPILIGTMLPVLFIVYFIGPITTWISNKFPRLGTIIQKILTKIRSSKKGFFELLEELAVIVLAALPIPIIGGAYTAALASFLFGVKPQKSIFFIAIGSSIGIILMIFLTLTGKAVL